MASFMMAFPEYLRSQRCMIVLRPSFTLSNLDETIMTLLRVNNFVMLKVPYFIFSETASYFIKSRSSVSRYLGES
jgi:hypothetical protein